MNNERNTKRCWVQLFTWTTPPTQQRAVISLYKPSFSCSLGLAKCLGRPRVPRPIPETPKPSEQLDNYTMFLDL